MSGREELDPNHPCAQYQRLSDLSNRTFEEEELLRKADEECEHYEASLLIKETWFGGLVPHFFII